MTSCNSHECSNVFNILLLFPTKGIPSHIFSNCGYWLSKSHIPAPTPFLMNLSVSLVRWSDCEFSGWEINGLPVGGAFVIAEFCLFYDF